MLTIFLIEIMKQECQVFHRSDVGLLAYSPLAQGYLSGKYLDGNLPEGSEPSYLEGDKDMRLQALNQL